MAILHGLRLTEIMYNPAGGNAYEFLELTNVGGQPINLRGVEFVDGIAFLFAGDLGLGPGEEVLLVRDAAAFRSRYGNTLNVAGVSDGALDNSGEQLARRLPAPWDANILCFEYGSFWHGTNGSGFSLQLLSPTTGIEDLGEREIWAASTQLHGTPDSWTPPTNPHPGGLNDWLAVHGLTIGELALDTDSDGLTNLFDYGLDTDRAARMA